MKPAFAEITSSHDVAMGIVAWPFARFTLVVKATLMAGDTVDLRLASGAPAVEPLRLETFGDDGRLRHGSDFAPYKSACDVVVLHPGGHAGKGRMEIGPIALDLAAGDELGPLESLLGGGGPSHDSAWAEAATYDRFQIAPPAQRMPWPVGPVDLHYQRSGARLHGRFPGFVARAVVVSVDGGRVHAAIPMALDTLELMPAEQRVCATYRGVFDLAFDPHDACLEVELADAWGSRLPDARTRMARLATVDEARRHLPSRPVVLGDDPDGTLVPRRSAASTLPTVNQGLGTSLPFAGWAPDREAKAPMDPKAFAALRRISTAPVAEEEGEDVGSSTVSLRVSPAAFEEPAPPSQPRRDIVTLGGGMRLASGGASPAPRVVDRAPPAPSPDEDSDESLGTGTVEVTVPPELLRPARARPGLPPFAATTKPVSTTPPARPSAPPLAPPLAPPAAREPFPSPPMPMPPMPVSPPLELVPRVVAAPVREAVAFVAPESTPPRFVESDPAVRPARPRGETSSAATPEDIERWMRSCAAIRAAVFDGRPLADVLEERASDEATYRADESRLRAALTAELSAGRLDANERWLRAIADARRRLRDVEADLG